MNKLLPYSSLRQAGNLYFASGQIGIDPVTRRALPGIAEQTHQVLKNLDTVLHSVGLGLNSVVKTTVFLKNIDDFVAVNTIYAEYFAEPMPARSCVEVSALPGVGATELLIEIEAIAVKDNQG
ncbi:MAG: Rid family detoxifying hydrolase [Patescibacteria group bacterium]